MLKTVEQSVSFPLSAQGLYKLYMNPRTHAAVTGATVKISAKPQSKFSAFNGMITGTTLSTIPGKLIVQRWRSRGWKSTDVDSILILNFVQVGKRGRIDLTHVGVPQHDFAGVTQGWDKYYWKPLRQYLKKRR